MKTLELNTAKIEQEMKRLGLRRSWLAGKLKMNQSIVNYIFRKKPVSYAVRLGKIFGIEPKDLIR